MEALLEVRQAIRAKTQEKDSLEKKIIHLQQQESHLMGSHGSGAVLVDREGFPLADVDVHSVLIARNELVRTQNDYKNLCLEIEKLMFNMHAVAKEAEAKGHTIPTRNTGASTSTSTASNLDSSSISSSESIEKKHADRTVATSSTTTSSSFSSSPKSSSSSTSTSTSSSTSQQLPEDNSPPLPIFTVRTVLSGSPAAAAGLQPGDAILAFGPVSRASVAAAHARDPSLSFAQTATRSVGLAVRESVGVPMRILIARQTTTSPASERPVEVSLTPQTWSGTGLLGCEVVPVAGI